MTQQSSSSDPVAVLIKALPAVIRVNHSLDMHFVPLIVKVKYDLLSSLMMKNTYKS